MQAAAPKLRALEREGVEPEIPPSPAANRVAVQRALFQLGEPSRVVPISGEVSPAARRRRRKDSALARQITESARSSSLADQGVLDFLGAPAGLPQSGLRTSVDAFIYCAAPVASLTHRMLAWSIDSSLVLIALGLFAATLHTCGFPLTPGGGGMPFLGGAAVAIGILYEVIWCASGVSSPGLRWTGLRLVNFDGRPPEAGRRHLRLAAGFISVLAAGIGIIWALLDEESLTWQDHMSQTFLTPV